MDIIYSSEHAQILLFTSLYNYIYPSSIKQRNPALNPVLHESIITLHL